MPSYIDLHLHTNHSDGSDPPEKVVDRAVGCGFAGIAITDHDTVGGVEPAGREARLHGVEFLEGVEISTFYGRIEAHVVGLGIDVRNELLTASLRRFREARADRIDRMVARLNELGVPIERSEIEIQARKGSALGRVHVARALVARGAAETVQQAFDAFLRSGRKAYIAKEMMSCKEAIALIHAAGGLAFLAHPGVGMTIVKLLPRLLDLGFDGIEVYHTKHTPGHVTQFTQIALERDLLITGGSDCHGTALKDDADMGKVRVPYYHFERILKKLDRTKR
jgi:predicted metal-dependent phosphoesterase TrpH